MKLRNTIRAAINEDWDPLAPKNVIGQYAGKLNFAPNGQLHSVDGETEHGKYRIDSGGVSIHNHNGPQYFFSHPELAAMKEGRKSQGGHMQVAVGDGDYHMYTNGDHSFHLHMPVYHAARKMLPDAGKPISATDQARIGAHGGVVH